MPSDGLKMNSHSMPAIAGGDRVGPDQQRAVEAAAADHPLGHHRQQEARSRARATAVATLKTTVTWIELR